MRPMRSLTELALEKVIKLQNDLEDNELALETLEKIFIYIYTYVFIDTHIHIYNIMACYVSQVM